MPIEMFKDRLLTEMDNTIDKTIRVDTTSTDVVRGNFTRVCMEIDLNKPMFLYVMIMGRVLKVEYEGLSRICFQC